MTIQIVHYVRAECRTCGWLGTLAGVEMFAREQGRTHTCLDLITQLPESASAP